MEDILGIQLVAADMALPERPTLSDCYVVENRMIKEMLLSARQEMFSGGSLARLGGSADEYR